VAASTPLKKRYDFRMSKSSKASFVSQSLPKDHNCEGSIR